MIILNFVFRALKSLKERKGKTFIIFAIMFTACIVILASFSIQSATEAAAVLARQKLGAKVSLVVDHEKLMENQLKEQQDSQSGQRLRLEKTSIPLEYLDKLKDSEYIKNYLVSSTTSANVDGVTPVGNEDEDSNLTNDNMKMPMEMNSGDFTIKGVNNFNNEDKVNSSQMTVVDGKAITDKDLNTNVVMVDETLAKENSLKVGDEINITSTSNNSDEDSTTTTAKILGIYKDSSSIDEDAYRFTAMLPYNQIYAPYTLANKLKGATSTADSIEFNLQDPIDVDKFIKEGQKTSIDFDKYKLDGGDQAYKTMMGPIENVATFSKTMVTVVGIFAGVILSLVIMLSIKDRVNEIGIIMALGEKRVKIIAQFLSEIIIVLAVAICISSAFGNTISNVVGDILIQNEISTQQETTMGTPSFSQGQGSHQGRRGPSMSKGMGGFGSDREANVEVMDELNIKTKVSDIGKMSLWSLLIAIVATIIPASFIMRFNPKTILSKHN